MSNQPNNEPLIPPTPSDEAYGAEIDQGKVFTSNDPVLLFQEWLDLAKTHEMNDPNAMALATVDADSMPDVRVVLLKAFDRAGLSFYTNTQSEKGKELAAVPRAAVCFHWKSIRRQVRFRGTIVAVSDGEADAYFASRARGSQIGAWASDQSRSVDNPARLGERVKHFEAKFEGMSVPRPPHWHGYRLIPNVAEFWVNRPYRLHDRLRFSRTGNDQKWVGGYLYP